MPWLVIWSCPVKRRLEKDVPGLARRKMKKELHKLREIMPEFDLTRAIALKNKAASLGLWSYTGDAR